MVKHQTPLETEEELRMEGLRLKVQELRRPPYRRLNFWTSTIAIVAAIAGLGLQHVLSNIEFQRTKLEHENKLRAIEQTRIKGDSLTKVNERVAGDLWARVDKLRKLKDTIEVLQVQLDLKNRDLLLARQQDSLTTASFASVVELKIDQAGLSAEKRAELKQAVSNAQPAVTRLRPRVYIQIAVESQRATARQLQDAFKSAGYLAPGIENIDGKATAPRRAEVRYYRDDEKAGAENIVSIIQQSGIEAVPPPLRIPGVGRGTRPGHYEVWLPRN